MLITGNRQNRDSTVIYLLMAKDKLIWTDTLYNTPHDTISQSGL